jgi:hypothetical protein
VAPSAMQPCQEFFLYIRNGLLKMMDKKEIMIDEIMSMAE